MAFRHVQDLVQHLMWTRTGSVWATWRIEPLAYNRPLEDQELVRVQHRALARVLTGEALMFSIALPQDGLGEVEAMMAPYEMASLPMWVEECFASMERFQAMGMGRRLCWLSVPLANVGRERWAAPARAGLRMVQDAVGLPNGGPSREEIVARLAQAQAIEELIPAGFAPRPVSEAEHAWCVAHAARRGMLDVAVPEDAPDRADLQRTSGVVIPAALLDEGARTDDGGTHRLDVMGQRVVKVQDVLGADLEGMPPSYQCLMALAQPPAGGLAFPGSEIFHALDRSGLDVDWAMRLRINSHGKVLADNRAAMRRINEQYEQREREVASGLHDLNHAQALLAQYDSEIAVDPNEIEVQHTVILAIGAASAEAEPGLLAEAVQNDADALAKSLYNDLGLKFERLPGKQSELWAAMLPGVPRSKIVTAYAQVTTSDRWAGLVPFISTHLGGAHGPVLAVVENTSRPQAMHIDLAGYPELDKSGSILFVGEMGSGKSFAQKTCCYHVVATGGFFCAIDKSAEGEWGKFAAAFSSHTIVDPLQPAWSMDPLRVFPSAQQGVAAANAFLIELLNLDAQGELAQVLDEVLTPQYLLEHDLDGLGNVVAHLLAGACALPGADQLAKRLAFWARKPLARVIFDSSLPPADLGTAAIVWRTHGMDQPSAEELRNEHLFRNLGISKVFGRAYYRLLVSVAKTLCFADPTVAAAFVMDEFYDAAVNPANVKDLSDFIRQGRRPRALLIAGTHDVGDLGDDTLAALIPTRVMMRPGGADIAERALTWIGFDKEKDPRFEAVLKVALEDLSPVENDVIGVRPERRGECYIRDAHNNIDRARILGPAVPEFAVAVGTTPAKSGSRV